MTSTITLAQHEGLRQAFESAFDAAVLPERIGQLELFSDEEERFLQQEVARLLYEPKLPSAMDAERKWVDQLRELSRDESLVVGMKAAAGRYAAALEKCLPEQKFIRRGKGWLTLPGCYYTRKPVTAKTNKGLFTAALTLRQEAKETAQPLKKWLAEFILAGEPAAVSNFKMECLYLLRGADGNVTRLVRLVNTRGEMSAGREVGGADLLPSDMYAGAEKFRQWVASKGNFTWGGDGGAGNTELQSLQWDVTVDAAFRVVQLIEYCGWHEIAATQDKPKVIEPGAVHLNGLWFYDEVAIAPDGRFILPDEDGIFWHDGEGFAFSRKGREAEFTHGRPKMRPDLKIEQVRFDVADWEAGAQAMVRANPLGAFFREVCQRFNDTAGGLEGWMAVGSVLAYAVAPELFQQRKLFPGLWVSGQMGSGKTTFISWLMSLAGFETSSGLGLISKNVTAVGVMCQMENYSNLPVWLDEFRQMQITDDKAAILRDCYNRQLAAKWSPDGFQRVIRTAALVSGESTTSDAATRSRYPHVQISEQRRVANHYEWMQAHQEFFFFFWRELMVRRAEYVALVLKQVEFWMEHAELAAVPSRDRITHAVSYAAFAAAAFLFESHAATELVEFRKFVGGHAAAAAADVKSDVNVNVFIQELIVAYNADAVPASCFRVERLQRDHPPGAPNQGVWDEYTLFIDPEQAISYLQIYLRKGGQNVSLKYKDLRDQLSKNNFWVPRLETGSLKKRFGSKGSLVLKLAWGIKADEHPLGYAPVSDEELLAAQVTAGDKPLGTIGPVFKDGDPRKGPLFDIIEGVMKREVETA